MSGMGVYLLLIEPLSQLGYQTLRFNTSIAVTGLAAVSPGQEAMLVEERIEVPVQVNGKVRSVIRIAADADPAAMEAADRADEKVVAAPQGKPSKRVIKVAGRLINFVV
jgi:leucyl-tRNA synthetase